MLLEAGRYLTAAEFEPLRAVPSIVFLNCCHLGKLPQVADDVRPSVPGAWGTNLASQLIEMGVGVVVVAAAAVSDVSARLFASTLYSGLLEGRNLMSALREARKATYDAASLGDMTWGAYQVYGSPGFVMRHASATVENPLPPAEPVSRSELVDQLLDIATRAGRPASEALAADEQLRELDELQSRYKDTLAGHGEVEFAFGQAYACLGEYALAEKAYRRALKSSDAPLQSVEQLADVEVRQAERWWLASRAGEQRDLELEGKAERAFERARRRLESLLEIAESAERWALLGSNRRRRATCTDDAASRKPFLDAALKAYTQAAATRSDNRHYHLTQVESLNLCIDPSRVDRESLERARQLARAELDREPFAPLAELDADLILHAADIAGSAGTTPGASGEPLSPGARLSVSEQALAREMAARYALALESGSDHRQRASVASHLDALCRLVTHPVVAEWLRLVHAGVSPSLGARSLERWGSAGLLTSESAASEASTPRAEAPVEEEPA